MEELSNNISEKDQKYQRARKRIAQIKGFYQHLLVYCLYTPFTIFINYHTYWDYKWFWYSIGIWGIGLLIHALVVFVYKGTLGNNWEKRKIEELMRKDKNKYDRVKHQRFLEFCNLFNTHFLGRRIRVSCPVCIW